MQASVGYLVIDAIDPERLTTFWCAMLGVEVDAPSATVSSSCSRRPRTA